MSAATEPSPGPARSEVFALLAGVATVAAVAVASLLLIGQRAREGRAGLLDGVHLSAVALFAAAFIPVAGPWRRAWVERLTPYALTVAILAASLAVATLPEFGLAPVLFILSTALAANVMRPSAAAALIAGQTLVVLLATLRVAAEPLPAIVQSVAYAGFQVFALTTTLALITERRLRHRLALVNAELQSARALLDASSRHGERLRIARELHDLIGHHLTALALQLEVADHLAEGRSRTSIERARAIARLLLADVRGVVSDLRDQPLDVSALVRSMVADLPRPRVVLDLPPTLTVGDDDRAQAALRLIQEALTNTLRHSDATTITIAAQERDGTMELSVYDDGRGCDRVATGNGLRGMRERIDAVGGDMRITSANGAGFRIDARIPTAGAR